MDFNSLKDQVSNLTLYDLKAGVRKVQNGKLPDQGPLGSFWPDKAQRVICSCHELYRDGVEGTYTHCPALRYAF